MTNASNSKETKYRFAAFAGVLLVVSGLVVTLFDEARGAEIVIQDIGTFSGSRTINVDVTVPDGQQLPVTSATAVVETNPDGDTSKQQGDAYVIRAIAQCDAPIVGCSSTSAFDADETVGGGIITAITFVNFYWSEVGDGYVLNTGYEQDCTDPADADNNCDYTNAGGYGYSAGQPAAGYGYPSAAGVGPYTIGSGYGYGYDGDDLILRFQVTVDGSQLGNGDYFLTFIVGTSVVSGEVSSPATAFTVGGGGGGGTGGTTDGSGGSSGTVTINANSVTPPTGALSRHTGRVTATADQTVEINLGDEHVTKLTIDLAEDASDVQVSVTVYPADSAPPGASVAISRGGSVAYYIVVDFDGAITEATFDLLIEDGDMGDPEKALLLHWNPDSEAWEVEDVIDDLEQNADGDWEGTATTSSFSTFAVAFDEEAPTVTLELPDGEFTGSVDVTAEADDNVDIERVEFYVGDQLVATDREAPYEATIDTASFSNGNQTVRVVAYDHVGQSSEDSGSATFQNEGAPGDGDDDDGDLVDGGMGGGSLMWLWILLVLAIIGIGGYFFYQSQQKK